MFLALVSVLILQTEPRFTMAAEPGDMVAAELFEMDGGLTDEHVGLLLGDATMQEDASEDLPGFGPVRRVIARRADGSRIVLGGALGHEPVRSRICRVTSNPEGTVDNRAKAARWCASFVTPPQVFVAPALPPLPAN